MSAISLPEQLNVQWDYDEVPFVLDKHAEFDSYSACTLQQQSTDCRIFIIVFVTRKTWRYLSGKRQKIKEQF